MSWKERWQEASFRKVKFLTESLSTEAGRRRVVHEYPYKDEPHTEDLGLKARRYTVNAYVIGEDHDLQRNQLLQALEAKGVGELIHPEYGLQQVVVESLTQSTNEQTRISRFAIVFVQAGKISYPRAARNVKADLVQANMQSRAAIQQRTAGLIDKGLTTAQVKTQMAAFNATLPSVGLAAPPMLANGLPAALNTISLTQAAAAALALDNAMLLPLQAVLPALPTAWTVATSSPSFLALNTGLGLLSKISALNSASYIIQQSYPAILAHVLAWTALYEYESVEQAQSLRQQLHSHLLTVAQWMEIPIPSAPVMNSLRDLLVIVDAAAEQQLSTLPHAFYMTLPSEQPLLAFGWQQYKNIDKIAQLQQRNPAIVHPLFISTSRPVEVLK